MFLLLGISGSAWNQNSGNQKTVVVDTIPNKNQKKIVDLDQAMQELDKAEAKLESELSKQDWDQIEKQIKTSLEQIDMVKIQKEIELALKELDAEKIKAQIAQSMKEVDWKKIQEEIDASIAKIDLEKIKVELQELKEVDLKNMKIELEKIQPQIEKSLAEAKVQIEKARTEIKEYKAFVDGLEKDGLINKANPYKIEHKDGVLKINGKEQSQSVYNKYRAFLDKHKSITIERDLDDLDIDLD